MQPDGVRGVGGEDRYELCDEIDTRGGVWGGGRGRGEGSWPAFPRHEPWEKIRAGTPHIHMQMWATRTYM